MVLCAAGITLGNIVSSYEFAGDTAIRSIAGFLQGFNSILFIKMGLASFLSVTVFLNSGLDLFSVMLVAQWCPTHHDPVACSPQGFSVHGFSRQEYWLPFSSLRNLPNPGIKPGSLALQADFFFNCLSYREAKNP